MAVGNPRCVSTTFVHSLHALYMVATCCIPVNDIPCFFNVSTLLYIVSWHGLLHPLGTDMASSSNLKAFCHILHIACSIDNIFLICMDRHACMHACTHTHIYYMHIHSIHITHSTRTHTVRKTQKYTPFPWKSAWYTNQEYNMLKILKKNRIYTKLLQMCQNVRKLCKIHSKVHIVFCKELSK